MLKDILEYWISKLEEYYSWVYPFEKGYEQDLDREDNTAVIYHYKKKTIKKYIDIKYENTFLGLFDKVDYEYVASVFPTENYYKQYRIEKYSNIITPFSPEDRENREKLFQILLTLIIGLKLHLRAFDEIKEKNYIKFPKIGLFSSYLISWAFILTISYYCYPVEFHLFKYFIRNLMLYLICCSHDPFNDSLFYSF